MVLIQAEGPPLEGQQEFKSTHRCECEGHSSTEERNGSAGRRKWEDDGEARGECRRQLGKGGCAKWRWLRRGVRRWGRYQGWGAGKVKYKAWVQEDGQVWCIRRIGQAEAEEAEGVLKGVSKHLHQGSRLHTYAWNLSADQLR